MTNARRKRALRADEDGHPIDIEGIGASPETVGRAMMKPATRRRIDRDRRKRKANKPEKSCLIKTKC